MTTVIRVIALLGTVCMCYMIYTIRPYKRTTDQEADGPVLSSLVDGPGGQRQVINKEPIGLPANFEETPPSAVVQPGATSPTVFGAQDVRSAHVPPLSEVLMSFRVACCGVWCTDVLLNVKKSSGTRSYPFVIRCMRRVKKQLIEHQQIDISSFACNTGGIITS